MNITKFGAFVNILPGRDGLLHISKLGRGKRIDRVEDVLDLGDELEVKVDDIDHPASSRSRSSVTTTATAAAIRWRRRRLGERLRDRGPTAATATVTRATATA